jgi:hypothetical protein
MEEARWWKAEESRIFKEPCWSRDFSDATWLRFQPPSRTLLNLLTHEIVRKGNGGFRLLSLILLFWVFCYFWRVCICCYSAIENQNIGLPRK